MKKIIVSLTTLFALLLPNMGQSLTGIALKEMCATDGAETNNGAGCLYFILAARESLVWGAQIAGYRTRPEGQSTADVMAQARRDLGICIPTDTPNRSVLNRILAYLEIADVTENDKSASLVVYDALKFAYPCE